MTRSLTASAAMLLAAAVGTPAQADDQIFVGSPQGTVYVADSNTGQFTYFACFCIGPVVSIQPFGSDLLVGDSFGGLWELDGTTGQFVDGSWTGISSLDMVIDGDTALLATTNGEIIRVDIATGAQIETITAPATPTSLMVFDNMLYVGGADGSIHRRGMDETDWSLFAQVTGEIKNLAARPEALIAASAAGHATLIDWAGGPDDGYYIADDVTDAGYSGGHNLFSRHTGAVSVYDAGTSQLLDTWTLPVEASAIFVRPGSFCPADTNRNGVLDGSDLSAWIAAYNRGDFIADQNNDLAITPSDFTAWIDNYNQGCD